MAVTNPILFNSAICGGLGGSQQRWISNPNEAAYAEIQSIVVAIATAIDEALGVQTGVNSAQADLMQSIAQGILSSRYPSSANKDDYDAIAAAIVAMYLQLKGALDADGNPNPTGDPNTVALFDGDGVLSDTPELLATSINPFSLVGIQDYREGGGNGPLWQIGSSELAGGPANRSAIGLDILGFTGHPSDPPDTYRVTEYRASGLHIREGVGENGFSGTTRAKVGVSSMELADSAGVQLLVAEYQTGGAGNRLAIHDLIIGNKVAAFSGPRMASGSAHPNVAHDTATYPQGSIYMREGFFAAQYNRVQIGGQLQWVRVVSPPMVLNMADPGGNYIINIADVDGSGNLADVVNINGPAAGGGGIIGVTTVGVPDGHQLTVNIEPSEVLNAFNAVGAGQAPISVPGQTSSFAGQLEENDVIHMTYDGDDDIWRCDKAGVVT